MLPVAVETERPGELEFSGSGPSTDKCGPFALWRLMANHLGSGGTRAGRGLIRGTIVDHQDGGQKLANVRDHLANGVRLV